MQQHKITYKLFTAQFCANSALNYLRKIETPKLTKLNERQKFNSNFYVSSQLSCLKEFSVV